MLLNLLCHILECMFALNSVRIINVWHWLSDEIVNASFYYKLVKIDLSFAIIGKH